MERWRDGAGVVGCEGGVGGGADEGGNGVRLECAEGVTGRGGGI